MRALMPYPLQTLLLWLVWLLLQDSLAPAQWLLGGVLALGLPLLCKPWLPAPTRIRSFKLLIYVLMVLGDIVRANVQMALWLVRSPEHLRPAFVEVPIELEHELALSLLVAVVSLTPASLAADLDRERGVLLVHGLNVPNPQDLIDEVKQRYEAPLKEIFPC